MRHVFYPAIVERVGGQLKLEMPDLGLSLDLPPDGDPYLTAAAAAGDAVQALRKSDAALPPPSPLTSFVERLPMLLFQVPIPTYRAYIRVGINMDPVLLHQVDKAACRHSMTRSAFLAKAAASALTEDELRAA